MTETARNRPIRRRYRLPRRWVRRPASQSRSSASRPTRSEEHTSEHQSLMRHSYAGFCLKKKNKRQTHNVKLYNILPKAEQRNTTKNIQQEHKNDEAHRQKYTNTQYNRIKK